MTSLHPDLLEILVCPQCKGELVVEESSLRCDACRLRYPVDDGIPIMLIDSALPVDAPAAADPAEDASEG
ncbi:MAG TPA: Trm112 family protein [Candidatus Dormibacteraeota bacterium]|nr:Trm112 family protein [Candidatus Dormibacteraeota bacterium]